MENLFAVKGRFTEGWHDFVDASTDEAGVDHEAVIAALGQELSLISNAESLVVLAGSGASLGIVDTTTSTKQAPGMSDLWNEVKNLSSFEKVKSQLAPGPIEEGNFEHVLSDAQARLALNRSDTDLETFITEAEDIVWKKCSFIVENSDLRSHELMLRKVARRSTRLQRTQVFTTNYDLAFETAAMRARFNVIDGFGYGGQRFDGASFDLDYVRRRPHEPLTLEPSVFHLLKLHGSVDWSGTGDGVQKIYGGTKPADPVLIYPSAAKYQLSYQQPYLEFISRFQIALRQPDVGLIVIGFGFNDDHLAAPIKAALRSNIGLRAVFVSPKIKDEAASSGGGSQTLKWIDELIGRGDHRLTMLAATFDAFVNVLPEVPLKEERDVHDERIRFGEVRA